jgi:hypothetical protein
MRLSNAMERTKIEGGTTTHTVSEFSIIHKHTTLISIVNARVNRFCYGIFAICLFSALSGCATNVQTSTSELSQAAVVLPAGPMNIHVDHAWVKDASTPSLQAVHRKTMEALREKIEAGGAFVASWSALGADGTYWHVAEKETYSADVIPEGARNLPIGSLSPILPGDGGLHLFRILGRESAK